MARVISEGDPNWKRKARRRAKAAEAEGQEETREMAEDNGKKKGPKPKGKMGGLDAAYKVLGDRAMAVDSAVSKTANSNNLSMAERKEAAAKAEKNKGMKIAEISARAIERGLWSPKGKTPAGTLSAAIGKEITNKGSESRFKKVGPGIYARA